MPDSRTPALMEIHWPDPKQLEVADQAWDRIEESLAVLVELTSCSNTALRDLLAHISSALLDPVEEIQWRTRRAEAGHE